MNISFDQASADAVQARLDALAKPPGSLARLESLAVWLAGCQGSSRPRADRARVLVFAGDHGVAAAQRVSPYPPAVTVAMVQTFAMGNAAVAVLSRQAGAELEIVDVGVAGLPRLPAPAQGIRFVDAKVAPGTVDLSEGPAMSVEQCHAARQAGREAAERAHADGVVVLALGEMGIGNTTPAAAVSARLLGRPAAELVGPGTGLDALGVAHKAAVVQRALDRGGPETPWEALADLGGFELVALAGCMERAAELRIPVLLDGFIVGAAALAAVRARPELRPFLLAATASAEPGHRAVCDALDLGPALLDWGLRLGEASGAAACLPLLRSACALVDEMGTLEEVLALAAAP
ncbi:nicotinate-nucleotide--dimethylbenzimidazole phosphoribosyltransferase [Myxococcota bacterium]|nr:nicotinate-nucleotide--dimethylbenzimidazole phosphoribosyltransferase [Myxococcota bacterium]